MIVVELVDRLGLLDLRDHVRVRAGLRDQRAQVAHVRRASARTKRDVVDAELEREVEVGHVLARQRRDRQRDAREVHALVRGDGAADDDLARARPCSTSSDAQPHEAVVDQHVVPGLQHVADHGRRDGSSPSVPPPRPRR